MSEPTWFDITARENFERAFLPASNQPNLRFLQLGVFKGDASAWLMENVLTHPRSVLHDVDLWDDNDELSELRDFNMADVEAEYDKRTWKWRNEGRITKYKVSTMTFLARQVANGSPQYNFIYIDADHTAISTLENAIMAYRLLKPGGVLCFDDYLWRSREGWYAEPQLAIDMFKNLYAGRMVVMFIGLQCWLYRTSAEVLR